MSKPLLLMFDNGHGFNTQGKRGVKINGKPFEEWLFNRIMKLRAISEAAYRGIEFYDLVPESHDITLSDRVARANKIYAQYKDTHTVILLSFHADAFHNEKASGLSCWTTKGYTMSDLIAESILAEFEQSEIKTRSDLADMDRDFEADFYIIKKTHCPAVLIEFGFMTNQIEARQLNNSNEQDKRIRILFNALINI